MSDQYTINTVVLTKRDVSEKINPPWKLLCNWRHCTKGKGGKPAYVERLCPFCHRVGYCCKFCLAQDIYGHTTHECSQQIKDVKFKK